MEIKIFMRGLFKNEIKLTLDLILGLIIGEIIIRLKISDMLMKKFMPFLKRHNIPQVTCIALAASAGSSKTGAAIIASSLEKKQISEYSAVWSVLMLPLPSYLRRWPSTFALSLGMAGTAGGIFALSLLLRSTARFFVALFFLKRGNENFYANDYEIQDTKIFRVNILSKLIKTLPLAWLFFAVSYSLVPVADKFFQSLFENTDIFLPLSGWAIAAASIAHVSSALALAGGAMASGELNATQAVFALILGSGLGTATRILRQNAGYYFGLFPARIAKKMLLLNFATIMPLIIINLIFAGLALLF